jgi:hypothetical protein
MPTWAGGSPAAGASGPLGQLDQVGGDLGRRTVTSFLGQACVADQVQEPHRRGLLHAPVDPGLPDRSLDVFHQIRDPRALLLPPVQGQQPPVVARGHLRAQLERGLDHLPLAQARPQRGKLDPGVEQMVLGLGDPP